MAVAAMAAPLVKGRPHSTRNLPGLREDLQLLPAPRQAGGAPAWNLYDPVRHAFFLIGWREVEILGRWRLGEPSAIADCVTRETTLRVTPEQVAELLAFLRSNALLQPQPGQTPCKSGRRRSLSAAVGQHLFRRVPLWHPDLFLAATLPLVRICYTRSFWCLTLLAGLLGLYLIGRQWQSFVHTFPYFFTSTGILLVGVALLLIKLLHELAHGYTAKHYGLKVPVMGVAFMLIWPLFYTDTTDTWRLLRKRQRLAVGAAGMLLELVIAVYATLLWSFLEDGSGRSVAFVLASTSWLKSLLVNLNPLMRFDGYYLLADVWEMPNLQPRAFRAARWWLGRVLLGFSEPCPENLSPWQLRRLLLYALAVLIYRLLLFSSIGLLLYLSTFKALGLPLLVGSLALFIGRPVLLELQGWWQQRDGLKGAVLLRSGLLAGGLLALLFLPWQTTIYAPAVLKLSHARLHAPAAGRLAEVLVSEGQQVQKGDLLLVLQSPALDFHEARMEVEVAALRLQLERTGADRQGAERIRVLEQRLATALTTLSGYREQKERLRIRAPLTGTVMDLAKSLRPGRWLHPQERLALLVDTEEVLIEGYVRERDLARLVPESPGRFYPSRTELPVVDGRLAAVHPTHEKILSEPVLASFNGGGVAALQTATGEAACQETVYKLTMKPETRVGLPRQLLRGTVRLQSRPQNLVERIRRAVLRVVIRESGF